MSIVIGKGSGFFTIIRDGQTVPETYPVNSVVVQPIIGAAGNFNITTIEGQLIVSNVNYANLTNADTGVAFTSASDFQTYFQTNFFRKAGGTAGNINAVAPITYNSGTGAVGITQANTSTDGFLAHADWNIFNTKQAALTFDSSPTSSSSNPVTSGGVFTSLAGKQASLTFDSTPTNASSNPVTSAGIFTALAGKAPSFSGTGYSKYTGGSLSYVTSIPIVDLAASTISGVSLGSNLFNISATDTSLTFSGSYNGSSAQTVGVNYAMTPTWTGKHIFQTTNTASSGTTNYGTVFTHIGNQTSTAGFTDIFLNSTGTFGSGTHNLIDLQLTGSSKFSVTSGGFISSPSGIGLGGISNINTFSTSGSFSQDALLLTNSAASASGTPSLNSNRLRYSSSVWNTTPTAAANYASIINELRTITGTTPTYKLWWAANLSTTTTPGTFTDVASLDNLGNFLAVNSLNSKHIIGTTSAPTIAAGTGAGTSPTVSVVGNDMAGTITITTGTSPAATNAIIATITFNSAYASAPRIIIDESNTNAQGLVTGTNQPVVPASGQTNGVTTTTFVLQGGTSALAASTTYLFTYHVIQ